ncbi:N-acetyltransferase 5 [Microbotryomycetes sp. JL201]|nr:N-acetyltransferase 5 [Microbotryomycetes sp. JL201]
MSLVDSLPVLPSTAAAADANVARSINGKRIRVPPRVTLGELTPNNIGTVKKLNNCLFPVAYTDKFYKDVLDPAVTPEEYSRLVFYQDIAVGNVICKLESTSQALPQTLVDAVSSTSPAPSNETDTARLYVMTLGVLSPYRRQGLASKLIRHVIHTAEQSHNRPQTSHTKSHSNGASLTKDAGPSAGKKQKKDSGKKGPEKDASKVDKDDDNKPNTVTPPKIESIYLHVQVSNDEARQFWEKHGFTVRDTIKNYYRKIEPRDAWVLEREIKA